MGELCNNIGLMLVCLPSGGTDVTASPSQYMNQPSGIPILSPVFLCTLVIPIPFEDSKTIQHIYVLKLHNVFFKSCSNSILVFSKCPGQFITR